MPVYVNKENSSEQVQAIKNDGYNDHILEHFVKGNYGTEVPENKPGQWVVFNDNPTDPKFWTMDEKSFSGTYEEILHIESEQQFPS